MNKVAPLVALLTFSCAPDEPLFALRPAAEDALRSPCLDPEPLERVDQDAFIYATDIVEAPGRYYVEFRVLELSGVAEVGVFNGELHKAQASQPGPFS